MNGEVLVGDNLPHLRSITDDSVDLIYLDPPFCSKRDYHGVVGGKKVSFSDCWEMDDRAFADGREIAHTAPLLGDLIRLAGNVSGEQMQSYLTHIGIRVLELRRLLKPSGVLMFHCDDSASDWVGAMLRTVFGHKNYLNQVVWKRCNPKRSTKRLPRQHDVIHIVCKKVNKNPFNIVNEEGAYARNLNGKYTEKDEHGPYRFDNISAPPPDHYNHKDEHGVYHGLCITSPTQNYKHEDEHGKYADEPPHAPATDSVVESGKPWRGMMPTIKGNRLWRGPPIKTWPESAKALLPDNFDELGIHAKLDACDAVGMIHWSSNGRPRHKRYWTGKLGSTVGDIITHINFLVAKSKEMVDYPTQKPTELLRFLIESFSNAGDLVLDPYCGSGTTLIAAQQTGRQWLGMDLNEISAEIVAKRLETESERPAPKKRATGKKRKRKLVVDDGQLALPLN